MMGDKPNTIYLRNLNERIKINELKASLRAVFNQFGDILDIAALKSLKMRGQAFVSFKDQSSAAAAISSMNGFPFYDKPMMIQYAKREADVVTKFHGCYVERPKLPRPEDDRRKKNKGGAAALNQLPAQMRILTDVTGATHNLLPNMISGIPPVGGAMLEQPPNQILFVTNLPPLTDEGLITVLFSQFAGFKEVRLVPGRSDIAFVEFENEDFAAEAKNNLQGFKLTPKNSILITYANK